MGVIHTSKYIDYEDKEDGMGTTYDEDKYPIFKYYYYFLDIAHWNNNKRIINNNHPRCLIVTQ